MRYKTKILALAASFALATAPMGIALADTGAGVAGPGTAGVAGAESNQGMAETGVNGPSASMTTTPPGYNSTTGSTEGMSASNGVNMHGPAGTMGTTTGDSGAGSGGTGVGNGAGAGPGAGGGAGTGR